MLKLTTFFQFITATIEMYSDLLIAVDNNEVTMIVVMIDLSAAFDTVDITIMPKLYTWWFGYKRDSFKMDRILLNSLNYERCHWWLVFRNGTPEIRGPSGLLCLYITALKRVVQKYDLELYGSADDIILPSEFKLEIRKTKQLFLKNFKIA